MKSSSDKEVKKNRPRQESGDFAQFATDNRLDSAKQKDVQKSISTSDQVSQLKDLQMAANNGKKKPELTAGPVYQTGPIFRGMQSEKPNSNAPLRGNSSGFELGVRPNEGKENAQGFIEPQTGGPSTANKRSSIPDFTISKHYPEGSHNTTNQGEQPFRWMWSIESNALPQELVARNDHADHVSIEPAEGQNLTRGQFEDKVQSTQKDWKRIDQ